MPGGSPCLRVVLFSGLGAALLPTLAWAVPLDRLVYVRPVAVCDNAGNNCTDVTQLQNLATQATKDIWRQSGYDVVFLPARTGAQAVRNSNLLNIDTEAEARNLIRDNVLDINSTVIEAFLVNGLNAPAPAYGWGFKDNPGVIISTSVFGANRMDTLAHEIGHNFGFDHGDFGNNPQSPLNLMSTGRSVPASLAEIVTNGGTKDILNATQITEARNGITVDPTSSIGRASGRVLVTDTSVDGCFNIVVDQLLGGRCSNFSVVSTGTGSFVRAIQAKVPGLGDDAFLNTQLRNLLELTTLTLGDIGIDFSVEEPEDLLTATFANRNFNQGDILRLYTGFAGLSATEISFYFSDGYESTAAFNGESDSWEVISSRFVGAFTDDSDIPVASPLTLGQLSGPFEFADPTLVDVPEPGALMLALAALIALGMTERRNRRQVTC